MSLILMKNVWVPARGLLRNAWQDTSWLKDGVRAFLVSPILRSETQNTGVENDDAQQERDSNAASNPASSASEPLNDLDDSDSKTGNSVSPLSSSSSDFQSLAHTANLYEEDGEPDVLYRSIEILCLAHETPVLDSFESFVKMASEGFDLAVQIEEPCRVAERKTLLRSAFVHKKIRVQYEWYTHYRSFKFNRLTGSTADTFLEYLQRNIPEGVAMEVTKTRLERLPEGVVGNLGRTVSKEETFGGRIFYKH